MSPSKLGSLASDVGDGVIFSLVITGLVHVACLFCGIPLSPHAAGYVFLISGLLTGYLYVRSLNQVSQENAESIFRGVPDQFATIE